MLRCLSEHSFEVHAADLEQCLQAVWYLKTRALTLQDWIDDTEVEEEVRLQSKRPDEAFV